MASNSPIPPDQLKLICHDACDAAVSSASAYDHTQTQGWNDSIINSILKSLISETSSSKYKFAVNSTIIQHVSLSPLIGMIEDDQKRAELEAQEKEAQTSSSDDKAKKVGRRGMHSASGAYWNNQKDGMWSYKYDGGEKKGMDIVISIMWIAV